MMMKSRYIVICDEHTKLFGHRYLNSQLSLWLGLVQLFVCIWALAQHIFSIFTFHKILHCDFSDNSTLPPLLTHVDAIIYDIGIYHHLWGITGCVAQHLDGGYGRFCWCCVHIFALLFCLPFAFVSRPKPQWLWPLLIQQSAYGVGMLILSLAALPKTAQMLGDLQSAPLRAFAVYAMGLLINYFLLYVYWHWYWHVESLWSSARRLRRGETLTKSERRPFRKATETLSGISPYTGGGIPSAFSMGNGGVTLTTGCANTKSPQPPTLVTNANSSNGHLIGGEKKQMSVTIVEGNHPTALGSTMIITRIEPSTNTSEAEDRLREQQQQHHLLVNSTKSLPNGRAIHLTTEKEHHHHKHHHHHHRKRPPKLKKGENSIDSNTSAASTATYSTSTTLPIIANHGNNVAGTMLNQQRIPPPPSPPSPTTKTTNGHPPRMAPAFGLEELRPPPPSPAPPQMALNPTHLNHDSFPSMPFQYSPEEALPPRVRHLRRQEGRPKSPARKGSSSTNGGHSSRKGSHSSSAGSTTTSTADSRKSSMNQPQRQHPNASTRIGHGFSANSMAFRPPPSAQLLSARLSMPIGQLMPSMPMSRMAQRQNSLRQQRRRRLSLRQRNQQMAARKQPQLKEGTNGTNANDDDGRISTSPLLLSRQSLPAIDPSKMGMHSHHGQWPNPEQDDNGYQYSAAGYAISKPLPPPPPPPPPPCPVLPSSAQCQPAQIHPSNQQHSPNWPRQQQQQHCALEATGWSSFGAFSNANGNLPSQPHWSGSGTMPTIGDIGTQFPTMPRNSMIGIERVEKVPKMSQHKMPNNFVPNGIPHHGQHFAGAEWANGDINGAGIGVNKRRPLEGPISSLPLTSTNLVNGHSNGEYSAEGKMASNGNAGGSLTSMMNWRPLANRQNIVPSPSPMASGGSNNGELLIA